MSAPYPMQPINRRLIPSPTAQTNTRRIAAFKHESDKRERIINELAYVGVTKFEHTHAEGRELYRILYDDEHIMGAAYGLYAKGFALLVATDKRMIFIDKKLMYIYVDEVSYDLVEDVSYHQTALFGTIILHTRLGDYKIHAIHPASARQFVEYIKSRCHERSDKGVHHESAA